MQSQRYYGVSVGFAEDTEKTDTEQKMRVMTDKNEREHIWDKVFSIYRFDPTKDNWLSIPLVNKKYSLPEPWTQEQEKLVNGIFMELCPGEMYALDWQHDCFVFSPYEEIPLDLWFYDKDRDCNVYFPSYYPDGDYHFFITADLGTGLFGHPWRREIIAAGDSLIERLDRNKDKLFIE